MRVPTRDQAQFVEHAVGRLVAGVANRGEPSGKTFLLKSPVPASQKHLRKYSWRSIRAYESCYTHYPDAGVQGAHASTDAGVIEL